MATCANQNQPRICVAGSLWGVCDELLFADGLIVEINLVAPDGAFLVDAAGQCSDISLADYIRTEVVADTDGCWRTCDLAGNIGTGDNFIQPGNTRYFIRVFSGTDNSLLYQSTEFIIDADLIGTYPVDGNGCVQLCVLSPPATSTPTNPFCDAVQACETPWVGVNGPLISITPGDNPVGATGNGHQPTIGVDTVALCNFVVANCETPLTVTDAFGIVWTQGGTNGHDVVATFTPSTDPGQAITIGTDSQPLVRNAVLAAAGGGNPTSIEFTDNLGVPTLLDLCPIIAACPNLGDTSVVTSTVTAGDPTGAGQHNISHDDGAANITIWNVVSSDAGNDLAVGSGPLGGAFLDLQAGAGVQVNTLAPGVKEIDAPASSVVPNLPLGTWTHNTNDPAGNTAVPIVSTSADANQDLGIGSDGGSFLELIAGANITITPAGGGTFTIAGANQNGATSVFTVPIVVGAIGAGGLHQVTHDDGLGNITGPFDIVSQDANNDIAVGSAGGAFLNLVAGTGITLAQLSAGVLRIDQDLSSVTPNLGLGSWLHDDGTGSTTNIVSTSADAGNLIDIGTDGGSYLDCADIAACIPPAQPFSSVVPNLPAGQWTHNDNDPGGNTAVDIFSTSGDVGNDLAIGSDGGSFLNLIAGTNVTIVPGGGGAFTINATPGAGNTSVITPNLLNSLWVHDDGAGNLTNIVATSGDVGNDLGIGTDGGSFLDVVAGTGISITSVGGVVTINATSTFDCAAVQATFTSVARTLVDTDEVLVETAGGQCERVRPTIRFHKDWTYAEYCDDPTCVPGRTMLRDGTITGAMIAAETPGGVNEDWRITVNGVATGPTLTLAAATNTFTNAAIAIAYNAGDIIGLDPITPTPVSPSECGTVSLEITEAL